MKRFLSRLFSSLSQTSRPQSARTARPSVESLEGRELLAGSVYVSDGTLYITGTKQGDFVLIRNFNGTEFTVDRNCPSFHPRQIDVFRYADVHRIVFHGLDGRDTFENRTVIPVVAYGGKGNDWLESVYSTDTQYLYGGADDDDLFGGDGDDFLYGDAGRDRLVGLRGKDYLNGGRDGVKDQMEGREGADTFVRYETERIVDFSEADEDRYHPYSLSVVGFRTTGVTRSLGLAVSR